MIVRERKSLWAQLFAVRGSVLPRILPRIGTVALLSVVVVWLERHMPASFEQVPATPFTLLGLTLSIFLSFKNNACYDRWWEGRKDLGALIFEMRSFARELAAALPDNPTDLRRKLDLAIGFAHALAARLRGRNEHEAAARWLPDALGSRIALRRNVSDAILAALGRELADLYRAGTLSDFTYQLLETRLVSMSAIQASCERILNTPLPFAYSLLLHRTAMLFCLLLPFGLVGAFGWWTPLASTVVAYTFFGLDALGDELEEPFGLSDNDLPLDALVRVIEIDLLDATGAPAPEFLQPTRYVLT